MSHDLSLDEVARRITFYRQKAGLTKSALARACDVTPGAVTKWESASSQPPQWRNLCAIARACDVSIWTLLGPLPQLEAAEQ